MREDAAGKRLCLFVRGFDMADPIQDPSQGPVEVDAAAPAKILSPEASRALAEAAERRAAEELAQKETLLSGEQGGPAGLEPTRFGDWERKGLAVDF